MVSARPTAVAVGAKVTVLRPMKMILFDADRPLLGTQRPFPQRDMRAA
jgi:hypothetical protein